MKKLMLLPVLFMLGCVNNQNIDQKIDNTTKDMKLLNDYHTTKQNLHKLGNDYIFINLDSNGNITFYKIDKNYDLISYKTLKNLVITPYKIKVKNNKVYILAYSQTKNLPIFLILDSNGNILEKSYIGKKFNTPRDFIIQKNKIIIVLNSYSKDNSTDIVIYDNKTPHLFSSKYAEEATAIIPFNNGYLLVGNISRENQDAFIAYLDNNFKTKWVRELDFGLEESVKEIKIENNIISLKIVSQNYTGMEQYYIVKIDKNGKILNQSKQFEIKNYPLKFQG